MENPRKPSPADGTPVAPGALSDSTQESLEEYVNRKETDENLEELGRALSKEWKKPDLSFEKFEEKQREKDQ